MDGACVGIGVFSKNRALLSYASIHLGGFGHFTTTVGD